MLKIPTNYLLKNNIVNNLNLLNKAPVNLYFQKCLKHQFNENFKYDNLFIKKIQRKIKIVHLLI